MDTVPGESVHPPAFLLPLECAISLPAEKNDGTRRGNLQEKPLVDLAVLDSILEGFSDLKDPEI